ncbi:hypothetical protein BCR32DRAFT_330599 [Anaeromyces robustus]|uniref:C2H2-type domain-containing protein n=1 Tax=Anaeromyces robustus TaxID=1754192 RepID=A0A1Y1VUT6_9FUNG|nr:hypothetical protein BCR32DRAFT_330599 [Anaeromyces robustus]|eukprot:ORX64524.1 hypothetical protein BCR32DRAFT_330599 [Anaeromyces robustus]
MTFLQEQGEEADADLSLLYNEIFQNPMELQAQASQQPSNLMNLDEETINDTLVSNDFITPLNQDLASTTSSSSTNLSLINNDATATSGLSLKAALLNSANNAAAATASNALINQAILANKAKVAAAAVAANLNSSSSSTLLDSKLKPYPSTSGNTSTNTLRNSIKSSIPSPMVQTPFLHPMFSTPTFSYLNDSTVTTTNGLTSPLFEFTPPSTPPHTHANGSSKLKNLLKPSPSTTLLTNADTPSVTVTDTSPLLNTNLISSAASTSTSNITATATASATAAATAAARVSAINKQLVNAALEGSERPELMAFSPALNLPMKKLALFSPNVEDTAVTDIYPSSYNYLDDPIVNSPLLPINEETTTSRLLPLYNTGMYDIQSPFLMEKPDEGLVEQDVNEASIFNTYNTNDISPSLDSSVTATPNIFDTTIKTEVDLLKKIPDNSLNQVSPLLMQSPYLTDQSNLAASLNQSPFLQDQTAAAAAAALAIKSSPFLNEQSPLAMNSPFVGEQPIITLNDSPCLPDQPAGPLRNKSSISSPLLVDPRYAAAAAAYSKINSTSAANSASAYLLNRKRKLGMMNYPYGSYAKVQRLQGKKERNSLDEVSSGFIKKTCDINSHTIKPSPLLKETNIDIEPLESMGSMGSIGAMGPVGPMGSMGTIEPIGTVGSLNESTTGLNGVNGVNGVEPMIYSSIKLENPSYLTKPNLTLSNPAITTTSTSPLPSTSISTSTTNVSNVKASSISTTLNKNTAITKSISTSTPATTAIASNKISSTSTTTSTTSSTTTPTIKNKINNTVNNNQLNKTKVKIEQNNTMNVTNLTPTLLDLKSNQNLNNDKYMNEYSNMLINPVTSIFASPFTIPNKPTLVSMAGIKLDTKKSKTDDKTKGKEIKSEEKSTTKTTKTTKTPGKRGKRGRKPANASTTTTTTTTTVNTTTSPLTSSSISTSTTPNSKTLTTTTTTTATTTTSTTTKSTNSTKTTLPSTINNSGSEMIMKFEIEGKPTLLNDNKNMITTTNNAKINTITNNAKINGTENKFLIPPTATGLSLMTPGDEMDYHDIPTIKLGNTPNLDILSPASSSLGMTTSPGVNSPLLQPISFNLNSNIQLVKKRAKKKYPCTYPGCTKSFSRPCHRQSHERSHENSRPFVCPECKRAFCRKHDMIRHQRIHSKERPYQCKICKRKFARGDALVRHRTRPTSSCYQADMAYAKKLRQQQHRLLQQQQQLEYERLQKEKQMEEAAAAAAAAAAASGKDVSVTNIASTSTTTSTATVTK